jgi:hypothetical protein
LLTCLPSFVFLYGLAILFEGGDIDGDLTWGDVDGELTCSDCGDVVDCIDMMDKMMI